MIYGCSGGLEVVCPIHKPKVAGSTLAGVDRFSGCENRRPACHDYVTRKRSLDAFAAWEYSKQRRAASPLVRLVAEDERWEAPDPPPWCSPSKVGWNRAKSYCHLYSTHGYGQ
ncbi:hypothetical protein TNCV_1173191 [Trichonephila clavipes]|uniref:Uncharacterized protein n=1 Tax=Trichonephila clavipes TaxID=2585209 RepID=A0A8X6S071_TRICX|nr:hypothetical protein TNCV_1173191 [Trichonephila clavipes]